MRETLTIDGVNIYYKGNIRQGAVVFIHGGSLSALAFREQFDHIGMFPMVAIDLPGHGLSARAGEPRAVYNIPAYAQLLARIVDELELSDFILAGHSLGANIALEAAELLHGLRGLFLFSMNPFSVPPQLDKMCRPNPFLGYLVSGRLRPMEAMLVAGEMLPDNYELKSLLASWILGTDTSARLGFAASLGLDQFSNELAILENFKKPLAIVRGNKDRFINPAYLDHIKPVSLWKNGIIELDAGHVPQMETPQHFNSMIEEFYRYALETESGKKGTDYAIPNQLT